MYDIQNPLFTPDSLDYRKSPQLMSAPNPSPVLKFTEISTHEAISSICPSLQAIPSLAFVGAWSGLCMLLRALGFLVQVCNAPWKSSHYITG